MAWLFEMPPSKRWTMGNWRRRAGGGGAEGENEEGLWGGVYSFVACHSFFTVDTHPRTPLETEHRSRGKGGGGWGTIVKPFLQLSSLFDKSGV